MRTIKTEFDLSWKALELQRHKAVERMKDLDPTYIPPADFKPVQIKYSDKVFIPQVLTMLILFDWYVYFLFLGRLSANWVHGDAYWPSWKYPKENPGRG